MQATPIKRPGAENDVGSRSDGGITKRRKATSLARDMEGFVAELGVKEGDLASRIKGFKEEASGVFDTISITLMFIAQRSVYLSVHMRVFH